MTHNVQWLNLVALTLHMHQVWLQDLMESCAHWCGLDGVKEV